MNNEVNDDVNNEEECKTESAKDAPTVLPPIPAKRYFTIGEMSELCGVKTHVLRYWEQEFTQLKPVKRRGNRRYYQHHEVLLVRRIRSLLYEEGFTINGARNKLDNRMPDSADDVGEKTVLAASVISSSSMSSMSSTFVSPASDIDVNKIRDELSRILKLLNP